jgi:hypothetical protein
MVKLKTELHVYVMYYNKVGMYRDIYLQARASSIDVTLAKWAVLGIPRHLIP